MALPPGRHPLETPWLGNLRSAPKCRSEILAVRTAQGFWIAQNGTNLCQIAALAKQIWPRVSSAHFQGDFRYSVLQLAPLHAPLSESLAILWFGGPQWPNGRIVSSLKLKRKQSSQAKKGEIHGNGWPNNGWHGLKPNQLVALTYSSFCFTSNDSL